MLLGDANATMARSTAGAVEREKVFN